MPRHERIIYASAAQTATPTAVSAPLADRIRVTATHGDADSITYGVAAHMR